MLDRADSPAIRGLSIAAPAASPAAFPDWARPEKPGESEAEAAFYAGAALARLDHVLRDDPPWSGALRQRLALRAAAACVARSGRVEDEAALRDAVQFTAAGGRQSEALRRDCGPAGRTLLAWRALTTGSIGQWRSAIAFASEALEIRQVEALQAAIETASACAAGPEAAPFVAAKTFALARRVFDAGGGKKGSGRAGESSLLAAWLADAVLAQKLHWPFAVPLLGAAWFEASERRDPRVAGEGEQTTRILSAYAKAAAQACDLSADLRRRAQKLQEAAPKLRAKGAAAALAALLDDDCLSAVTRIPGLSERGARRLFERLAGFGAIRELTGRTTFRLYGL